MSNKDPWDFSVKVENTGREYRELVHRIFKQTDDGRKLLEIWNQSILEAFEPAANPHFADGYECMVKQINYSIRKVEEGDNE